MRRQATLAALAWSALLAACLVAAAGEVTVTFYHTSDIHDHCGPLPRIARFVQDQKAASKNVLFLDSGDWCQKGDLTPLGTRGAAIAEMMGACGYDAIIPGNHDHSHGTPRLAELIDAHALPLVAANCTWPANAKPRNAAPYKVFQLEGIKVAVIGTATPDPAQAIDRLLVVRPIAPAVKDAVARLDGAADVIVVLTHLGPEEDRKLAGEVPRIDVILGGHHHKRFKTLNMHKESQTIIQHSGAFGECIGEVVIRWDGKAIIERKARLIEVTPEMPESPRVKAIRDKHLPGFR